LKKSNAILLMQKRIPTYVINLRKRTDRKVHIINEFVDKPEFDLQFVNAIEHSSGDRGLWLTISHSIRDLLNHDEDFFLLLEDDHQFTEYYNSCFLQDSLAAAKDLDADILLGGVSWFNSSVQVSPNLFAVDSFNATQFVIVFKPFYQNFIDNLNTYSHSVDINISKIATKKFILYPFISTQKEFGYSDATAFNQEIGYVTEIFSHSKMRLSYLNRVLNHYARLYDEFKLRMSTNERKEIDSQAPTGVCIPLYFISDPSIAGTESEINQLKKQFAYKKEFHLKLSYL